MKKKIFLVLILMLILLNSQTWHQDVWNESFKKISTLIPVIEENYFKPVDHEEMAYSSIKGVLLTLDPHSYFLNPKDLSTFREDYKGKYFGLGIQITKFGEQLKVVAPIEGTPAYRLGIQAGDVISHIEGESTKPISSFEAMQKLRGKKGTKVTITITREGLDSPMDLSITRAEIPLHSVPYAFMLPEKTGYIFFRNFGETTTREFREKMQMLTDQGMEKLILDFRGNPGGTFIQSLEVADELLPKGKLVVSIQGRKQYYSREFFAEDDNRYEKIPLIILVSSGTASAPEIISGAVQDHDRGLIIGSVSFGKGLVQTVFPLSETAAVALTTAKYYTPSGRSIQRDFSDRLGYRLHRDSENEELDVFYTEGGRKVFGQGGITPDYELPSTYKRLTFEMLVRGAFFSYGRSFAQKVTPLSQDLTANGPLDQSFRADDRILEDFKVHLKTIKFPYTEKDYIEAGPEMLRELEREIHASLWGVEEGVKIFRLSDPVIKKAMEVFPEAIKLAQGDLN